MKFQCQPEPPDSRRQASRLVKGKIARNLIKFEKQRSDYSRGRTAHHFISKVNIIVLLFTFYILPLLLKYPCMARVSGVYSSLIFKNRATSNHQKSTRNFSFKHSFKWTKKSGIYLFGRNLSFFFPFTLTFAITASRVQHHIKEQSQGTVKSKETRRLLLKSTKRTREFYRRNIVKWFSSMPHNSSIINSSFEFPAIIRNHS